MGGPGDPTELGGSWSHRLKEHGTCLLKPLAAAAPPASVSAYDIELTPPDVQHPHSGRRTSPDPLRGDAPAPQAHDPGDRVHQRGDPGLGPGTEDPLGRAPGRPALGDRWSARRLPVQYRQPLP